MTHFVMFDTETDLGKGLIGPEEAWGSALLNNGPFGGVNQQVNFITADLASVDRAVTRKLELPLHVHLADLESIVAWVVVAGHRP